MLQGARVKTGRGSDGEKKSRHSFSDYSPSIFLCVIHRGTNERRIVDDRPSYTSNFYSR